MTSKQLQELRCKYGITQREIADKTGISIRTVQEHEQGRRNPGRLTKALYKKVFDLYKRRNKT